MSTLFFLWGSMTVFNDILIPRFKDAFALSYFRAMLVQSAFFGAYFIGALGYFCISASTGDPIARVGYKKSIVCGLLVSAGGSAVFWPAATLTSYPLFLLALFVVGLGFAILQIAANPYITLLGPEHTASSRLNLAQGFNSIGTTVGPLVGGWLIFQVFAVENAHGAESTKVPYLLFCSVFVAFALVLLLIRLPRIHVAKTVRGIGALRLPHVRLGAVAIFMYVGGEVAVGSAIMSLLQDPSVAGMQEIEASKYVSTYWGGLMIGRFMAAANLSSLDRGRKQGLLVAIPVLALGFLWVAKSAPLSSLQGRPIGSTLDLWHQELAVNATTFLHYLPFVALCWILLQFGGARTARTLTLFSLAAALLLSAAMITGGRAAMWCVVAVGLFSSIGWSNTFTLALEGTGVYRSQASSLLVMAILGGALLPPLQGLLADRTTLLLSFAVPMLAYYSVAYYGWKGHRVGRMQVNESMLTLNSVNEQIEPTH